MFFPQILGDWIDCALAYDATLNPTIPYLAWSWRDSEIWQPDFLPLNLRADYVHPIGSVQVTNWWLRWLSIQGRVGLASVLVGWCWIVLLVLLSCAVSRHVVSCHFLLCFENNFSP